MPATTPTTTTANASAAATRYPVMTAAGEKRTGSVRLPALASPRRSGISLT